MLDQLLNSVQGQIAQSLKEDSDFDGDSEAVSKVAGETIISQLSGLVSSGNFSGIAELFSGEETNQENSVVNELQPNLANSLSDKLGLDSQTTQKLVMKILPIVMNMFNDKVKTNQATNNGIDIAGIIGSLTGGSESSQGGMSQITDIIGALVGGNTDNNQQQQQQSSTGGGIFNIIKGLFGKR